MDPDPPFPEPGVCVDRSGPLPLFENVPSKLSALWARSAVDRARSSLGANTRMDEPHFFFRLSILFLILKV